jgi:hypothetical protein
MVNLGLTIMTPISNIINRLRLLLLLLLLSALLRSTLWRLLHVLALSYTEPLRCVGQMVRRDGDATRPGVRCGEVGYRI